MAKVSRQNIKDEILWYVRNKLTDPLSRGTLTTDEFDGDGSTTEFTLTQAAIKNITTVTIGGTGKSLGTDYTLTLQPAASSTITFVSAPVSGTNNVDVTYRAGVTMTNPDTPRTDLRLSSYPRVAVTEISSESKLIGINADGQRTTILMGVQIIGSDEAQITTMVNDLKDNILDDAKNFFYSRVVRVVGTSPIIPWATTPKTEIVSQTITLELAFIFES